jgi:uncharacterized protein YbaA (DUF1428 family)
MAYVDGFVLPVPTANKEAFRRHAEEIAGIFKEHGALDVVECWGDDVPEGKVNSFHTAVLREPNETGGFLLDHLAVEICARRRHGEGHG